MAQMNHHARWAPVRRQLLLTLLAMVPILLALPPFFRWIAAKPGVLPPEPLLQHLPSCDMSVPLFTVLYVAVVGSIVVLLQHPARLVRALQAYLFLLLLRMASMALLTLEPPPGMVLLTDPVVQFFYPGNEPFTKDLFFSGHVATACLLALSMPIGGLRMALWLVAVLVAIAVLVQHVHWTVDVVAAPLFALLAWRLALLTGRPISGGSEPDAA